jgi:putative acetyltransferase
MTTIRPERESDHRAVRELNRLAFGGEDEARIIDALRGAADPLISCVAVRDEKVVGHILFTPVELTPVRKALGLGPMAVLPELQNQGIGSALVRAGLDAARVLGCEAVVVLGHPAYYPRFGFVPAVSRGLACEFPAPDEAFMVLELVAGSLAGCSGVVKYRPEFGEA